MFRPGASFQVHRLDRDTEGRIICMEIVLENEPIVVCNIYGPNIDSPEYFFSVAEIVENYNSNNWILGGDFNFCFDVDIDKRGTIYNNNKAKQALEHFMEQHFTVDIWRIKNLEAFRYTWKRYAPTLALCRLDYFLISTGMIGWVQNTDIVP